jgi:hypothetical protein
MLKNVTKRSNHRRRRSWPACLQANLYFIGASISVVHTKRKGTDETSGARRL